MALAAADGVSIHPNYLTGEAQAALLADIEAVIAAAPFFRPTMPRTGAPFSVEMTNCGPLGWVADKNGYRYQAHHPETGAPWPAMPERLRALWRDLGAPAEPEACLVNRYPEGAKMGLHQDRDEETFDAPVVSVSLGDTAVFRMGGTTRRAPTRSVRLASGDVVVFGGPSRLIYHGIDRILTGSSRLVPEGGRINLTLRRVTPLPAA
ncbi:alpha-ketoglutarate-dependent dioxygenase AlkB [Acuticoccus sp. M5D2P5]|uniref:alpha-ketoglutarate-dependent dioxygenase AlkB n=1 Tax=Acuticoccus kalidii TaxID=2910977 RepID=UPI001F461E6A|nr:alpha-ketoglutarate-dependent dioxygenase AlkB [Acuticoccus kalidii]MCF3935523.1 alpha-ketoglutarate-dependent dioxygenase AlkB [Acuticoccus kalidii]